MRRLFSCVLFGVLLVPSVWGQKVIRGTVSDAESRETLPAANIQIEGTFLGTISNADGRYELRIEKVPAVILVRYIGYESQRIAIDRDTPANLDILLQPVSLAMEEVVVTGENPAINIMRQVIARKQAWQAEINTYQAEVYNRFTMANDTGIVSVVESITETFWDRERGSKEVVKAQRKTSNMSFDDFFAAAMFVVNLYDDDIEIAEFEMIGVTHPDALKHYSFALEGSRYLDDQIVYDISVRPKNKLKSGFVGRISVLGEVYALLEVELRPGEAFLFPPPIQQYDVTYKQQFSNFGGDFWLPVDLRSDIKVKVSFPGLLTFPIFHWDQVSRMTNYQVNVELPDSLYAKRRYMTVDTLSVRRGDRLNNEGVAVPLSAREATAYETIDSTMTLAKAYKPKGVLARFVDMEEDEDNGGNSSSGGGQGANQTRTLGSVDFTPALYYNRVMEAHLALKAEVPIGRRLRVHGFGGYITGPNDATYGAGARYRIGKRRRGWVDATYRYGIAPRYTSHISEPFFNSLTNLFAADDYFDYYGFERLRGEIGYSLRSIDTEVSLRFDNERNFSVQKTTDYDLVGSNQVQRANPAVPAGMMRSLKLSVAVNDEDIPIGFMGEKKFLFAIEHSDPTLFASDFDFTKVEAQLDWRFVTLLHRRFIPNTLDIRLRGVTFRGDLPLQRFSIVDVAKGWYTPFGAMRAQEGLPYQGESLVSVQWEHSFRTLPFELLGLRRIANAGWNFIVHGGHAKTWTRDSARANLGFPLVETDGVHHEMGVSLSGILSIMRVDFTKRLDGGGWTFGIGAARIF